MAAESNPRAGVTRTSSRLHPGPLAPGRRRPGAPHLTPTSGGDTPPPVATLDPATTARRRIFLLYAVLAVVFSVAPLANNFMGLLNKDYSLWYRTGRLVLRGGEIYPKDHHMFPFMYPPSCAGLLAVASLPGETAMVISLTLLNSASWLAAVLLSVYLATGAAWKQHPLLYLVPSLCVVPFVHDMYLLGQPNLLLLALMLGAFASLRTRRPIAAGGLIALAAGIKAFPVLAVGYLVYRREWKATAAVGVFLAVLLLGLPSVFLGPKNACVELATWTKGMVLKYDADTIAQRPERCYSFKNQSIIAVTNRLLRPVLADGEADKSWIVNVVTLDFRVVNAVIVAASGALCLFYVATMPRRGRRTGRTDAAETAMLLVLVTMFSPLSFNYAYIWLIYPLTVMLHVALTAPPGSRDQDGALATLAAAVLLLALAIPFPLPAQAFGNLFAAALVLLIGLGLFMHRWSADSEPATKGDRATPPSPEALVA